jgi:glyoxylase-like metal-dependent hydrolase (beta-lactamase superfamily II)
VSSAQVQARAAQSSGSLPIRYLETEIKVAEPVEISEGIVLARLPLPFALNHINVYLIDEGDGWTLVDCGLEAEKSRECWEAILASPLVANRPIRRILVTHHHPDHIGLAGWLCQRFDAPLQMSAGELSVAGRYADPKRDVISERIGFWGEHGLPPEVSSWLMERMPRYSRHVNPLPADVQIIDPARPMRIGGRAWQVMVGRGHSPDHLSLYEPETGVLVGGDQVLPEITPNIGVWPGGDQNPLRSYLESLVQFAELPGDPLLLPSHRQPLRGVQRRVEELQAHHEERLDHVIAHCGEPMSCYQLLNALFGRPLRNEEVGFGLGEGVAHLNYLEYQGRVRSAIDDAGVRRFERVGA